MSSHPRPDDEQPATKGDLRSMGDELRSEIRIEVRALGVVVERIDSNVQMLAEAMIGMRTELKRDITELDARLSARIDRLEDAVRTNLREIRELKPLKTEMAELRAEVAALRRDFERRDAERLASLEARVTELEKRAGIA
jgi:hypothetical protein